MSVYERNNNSKYGANLSLPKYIEHKLDMLKDEFYLKLSYEEEKHLRSLTSRETVDQYAHQLLRDKL